MLSDILRRVSHAYGTKPIVYFETDDVDFVDEVFLGDPSIDVREADKREAVAMGGDDAHWLPLMSPLEKTASAKGGAFKSYSFELNQRLMNFSGAKSPAWACYFQKRFTSFSEELTPALWYYVELYKSLPSEERRTTIMFLSDFDARIPYGMEAYVEVIKVPLMDQEDIYQLLSRFFAGIGDGDGDEMRALLRSTAARLRGNTRAQLSSILDRLAIAHPLARASDAATLLRDWADIAPDIDRQIALQKQQTVEKNGILSFEEDDGQPIEVVGCGEVEKWILSIKQIFLEPERFPGAYPPKGALFSGVPGTGKSMMAKKVASLMNIPLVKMDMGSMRDKYMGESERKFRAALRVVEAIAPCVLFIDELEKAFATGSEANEVSLRIFGYMLSWMQDTRKPVFIFAAANDAGALNSAFLRSGRFDKKYFTFLPRREDCVKLVKSVLERRAAVCESASGTKLFAPDVMPALPARAAAFLDEAAIGGQFFSGADINAWINDAIIRHYAANPAAGRISAEALFAAMGAALKRCLPYGKTNLHSLSHYWLNNYFSPFDDTNGECLIRRSDFEWNAGGENPGKPYFKAKTLADFGNAYDLGLYRAVTGSINAMRREVIESRYVLERQKG